jgi:serine protease Do
MRGSVRTTGLVRVCLLFAAASCDRGASRALASPDDGGVALPPGAIAVGSVAPQPPAAAPPVAAPPPAPSTVGVATQPLSFAPIARAADPSVVTVNTLGIEEEISPFTHRRRRAQTQGLGTGFVIDKSGIILTNNHVVGNAQEIEVKLSDQRSFPAKVVGADQRTDVAVLRIEAKDLRALPLGDSDVIEVGDWVVAIGNPFGLSHTVSAGIISAKGRTRDDLGGRDNPSLDPSGFYDYLQTDASINPGNSGGPLLNLRGEVVGMNTMIRQGQGLCFAIPINMIKQLVPVLLRDGHFTRSGLGVSIKDVHELTRDERQELRLAEGQVLSGAVIEYVAPGGPADKAGLAPGDIIVSFDGIPIDRSTKLQWLASTAGVGRSATLRVQRDGKPFELKVILGQLPEQPSAAGR